MFEVAVAFPEDGHLAALIVHAGVGKRACDVADVASFVVVAVPLGEVVDTIEVVAVATSMTVASPLDLAKQVAGLVGGFGCLKHTAETETDFKEGPAVEPLEVDRGAFDVVVDFEGVGFVGDALEFASDTYHALRHGKTIPLLFYGFACHAVEFCFSFEGGGEREVVTGRC